jgi:ABC-type oligopeptide transport system ATPase subunit
VEAVRGIDLAIEEGECFAVLGPNGVGKTTTIEILEGLLEPTSGDVEILGMRWHLHWRCGGFDGNGRSCLQGKEDPHEDDLGCRSSDLSSNEGGG